MELHFDRRVFKALRTCVAMSMVRHQRQRPSADTAERAIASVRVTANSRFPSKAAERASRILVVEDELLIALLIEETIHEAGYRVSGVAHTMTMARQEFAKRNFDAVLLDINIDGRYRPEIADFLLDIGVPIAFVTGYDYLVEPRHQTVPVLQKPFAPAQLRALLGELVGARSPTARIAETA
jgi:CheY-like chemotaxis protein